MVEQSDFLVSELWKSLEEKETKKKNADDAVNNMAHSHSRTGKWSSKNKWKQKRDWKPSIARVHTGKLARNLGGTYV